MITLTHRSVRQNCYSTADPSFLDSQHKTQTLAAPHRSGMPCLKDMAVQLGISASRVVGHKGKLGINRPGGGQRDPMKSVGHQERLHTKDNSTQSVLTWNWFKHAHIWAKSTMRTKDMTHSFIFVIHFDPFDGELDGYRSPPTAGLAKDSCGWNTHKAMRRCSLDPKWKNQRYWHRRNGKILPKKQELYLRLEYFVFFGGPALQTCGH